MVEDIVLESPDRAMNQLSPPQGEARRVDFEYTLASKFSPYEYHYRLFNDCFLEIEKCDKHAKPLANTAFHVGLLEPKPQKQRSMGWLMMLGAVLTGVAAVVMAFWLNDYVLAAGTGALSAMLFAVCYFSYRDNSLFYSRSGKAPLISLSHRCRCKTSLMDFVAQLEQRIERNTLPASSQFFAEETKWHRILNEQGWISNEDYQKARHRILKQFNRTVS